MHDNPIDGRRNDAQGGRAQHVLFARVLELHPTHLTERELLLEVVGREDGTPRLTYEEAIHDLVGAGLLRIDGDSILPTRAALRAEELAI
jgi:hypothetical protein